MGILDAPSYSRQQADAKFSPVGSPQIAAGKKVLYYPDHLRRAQAKLAESQNRLCHIAVTGDSVSLGAYANDSATLADDTVFRRKGWVGSLRRLLGQRYGYPGEGILFPQGVGPAVPYTYQLSGGATYTGISGAGAVNQSLGLFGRNFAISTGGMTLTATVKADPDAPAGSKMAIRLGLWTAGGSVTPTVSIDGAAAAPVTGFSTAATEVSQEITLAVGLDPTVDHTVSLVGSSSFRPLWLSSYIQANGTSTVPSKGIAVHRMAESGTVLADAFAHGANVGAWSATNYDRQLNTAFDSVSPDLIVLAHNVNNLTRGRTVWNYSPTDVQTNTKRVVDKLVAKGYDVLLVNPVIRNPTTNADSTYTQADFSNALAAVAQATDYCAFLDVGTIFNTFADANAIGLYAADPNGAGVHPSSRGHAYIARAVAGALGL